MLSLLKLLPLALAMVQGVMSSDSECCHAVTAAGYNKPDKWGRIFDGGHHSLLRNSLDLGLLRNRQLLRDCRCLMVVCDRHQLCECRRGLAKHRGPLRNYSLLCDRLPWCSYVTVFGCAS